MEPNQINPSTETTGIPQGIPTGVFVPNNLQPAQAEASVQPVPAQPVVVGPAKEGPLDKILKGLARFFAKIMGQPDPITGAPNAASQAIQKSQNIVGKVRGAANQVVEKASNVAGKAVTTAADVANQAAQKVQQVIPVPVPVATTSPIVEQPTVPVVEQPVTPQETPTVQETPTISTEQPTV